MNNHRELSLLGLAAKANQAASGEFAVENAVKTGKAFLVLAAEDASENTRKKFCNMCSYYNVPFYTIGTKEVLGTAIGKENRAVVALLEEHFAVATKKKLDNIGCKQ